MKIVRARAARNIRKTTDFDAEYLFELWVKQDGICPITGWKLILPNGSCGWGSVAVPERASLDRVDSSKGYIVGNVRFIAFIANMAKNTFSDEEVLKFCIAVIKNSSNIT